MKVKKSEEQEGNYYIFGTKCLYVTEMDGGEILVVKEEKSHGGEMDFGSYVAKNKDEEWDHIKRMLKSTNAHLLEKEDPLSALADVMEEAWSKSFV